MSLEQQKVEDVRAALHLVVLQLTGRAYGSPRQIQMDAGRAISLLYGADIHNGGFLASTLTRLVRELGQRRPDVHGFVITLETFLTRIDEQLGARKGPE